ncbi:MAG: hypothetical protein PQJ59_01645 [Spirochaetales bacterium]|nr:hypothetical protein [Spirochaetales bacterium]
MESKFSTIVIYIGLISGILTIIAFFLTLMMDSPFSKRPQYYFYGYSTVSTTNGSDEIDLFWNGSPVENIKTVKFRLTNEGRSPIRSTDIDLEEPMRIELEDSSRIIKITDEEHYMDNNAVQIVLQEENIIVLEIPENDAIEKGCGIDFTIVYTGKSDNFTFKADIIETDLKSPRRNSDWKEDVTEALYHIFLGLWLTQAIFRPFLRNRNTPKKAYLIILLKILFMIVMHILCFLILRVISYPNDGAFYHIIESILITGIAIVFLYKDNEFGRNQIKKLPVATEESTP